MTTPFVALVVTATGLDPQRDRIREVAATAVDAHGERTTLRADLDTVGAWPDVSRQLKDLWRGRPVVTHDAARVLAVMAAEGLRLTQPAIDTAELAAILAPGLASADLGSLAAYLAAPALAGIEDRGEADVLADVFVALLERIAEYDDITLDRLALHVHEGGWPLAHLFEPRPRVSSRAGRAKRRLPPPEVSFLRDRPRDEPLEATGSLQPVDPRAVRAIIGPEGALSRVIAGFERRGQQETMAEAVAAAINDGSQILVEAGTGTGKSLAYLVPAALSATERGEPVVLSTNTLALQDQLIRKDVPDLQAALAETAGDEPIEVVALKGRANYLCLRRWFPWERQASLEPDEARLKAKVLAWLPRTETGDRSELRLTGGEEQHWRQISEEEGSCDPSTCVFQQRGQCFLFRARRAAEGAHLVVVNHALLLTDAASSNHILPDYDTLVIDEAHHLEDQATSQFTVTLNEPQLLEFADAVASKDGPAITGVAAGAVAFLQGAAADDASQRRARVARERLDQAIAAGALIRAAGRDLFAALEYVHLESGDGGGRERARRVTAATRGAPSWGAVDAAWDRLLGGLRESETALRWFTGEVDAVDDVAAADLAEAGERQELLLSDLSTTLRVGTELIANYAGAFDAPEAGRVFWLERRGPLDRIAFRSAPLDVSALLQERLFKRRRATILTSATLAVDGHCGYLASRLGVPDASSLIVPSPFDYRAAVLLHLSDDMPDPTHPAYHEALEQTLIETITATRGRALVLFTSHATLGDVARSITPELQDRGIVVLAQRRDGSPQQLVERLRREENVAVLGTASFWEGVDVSGDALSLLVIARLPFNVPTDPVFAARSESFEDAFAGYAVPQAVLRFKQGFGRLIRSSQDRGVCAVLDRRILTKRYGATFLHSLPECTVEVSSRLDLPRAARSWLMAAPGVPEPEQRSLTPA